MGTLAGDALASSTHQYWPIFLKSRRFDSYQPQAIQFKKNPNLRQ
jgi:hypothetical protein